MKNKLPNNSGFKVPSSYFDTIDEKLEAKLNTKSSSNKSGFTVPTSYFNTLEDNVIRSLEKKSKPKYIKFKSIHYTSIGIAATLLLFIAINLFNNTNIQETTITNLETTLLEDYIESQSMLFTSTEIIGLLNDVELDDLQLETIQYYNDDDWESYLLESDIDINELLKD